MKPGAPRRAAALAGLALLLLAGGAGCATTGERTPGDPLEPMNRGIFWFNERFDRWLFEPLATSYDFVTPERVQKCVTNFFNNLRFPVYFANNLLQGKVDLAYIQIGRFGINTVAGLGGLFDPATRLGLEREPEDFGQTLGVWGLGSGPYLVLPLLGPSSFRDAAGIPVDASLSPGRYLLDAPILVGVRAFELLNLRARYLEQVRENREMAFDYYAFMRDAYLSLRENQVRDGALEGEEAPDDLYYSEEAEIYREEMEDAARRDPDTELEDAVPGDPDAADPYFDFGDEEPEAPEAPQAPSPAP